MLKLRLCLALFAAALLAGCATEKVCDARGESEICEIHHAIMETEVVKNKKEWPMPSQAYLQARARYFRHAYPFLLPSSKDCPKCAVYICAECVRAEQEWKRRNE